jgi:hypothetical protein
MFKENRVDGQARNVIQSYSATLNVTYFICVASVPWKSRLVNADIIDT